MKTLVALAFVLVASPVLAAEPINYGVAIPTEVQAGRIGSAVVLCEQAEKEGQLGDATLRAHCATAMAALGDRLANAGSPENARKRWLQAAELDPRLLDDPEFQKKLKSVPEPVKPTDPVEPKPDPTKPDRPVDPNPDPNAPRLEPRTWPTLPDGSDKPKPRPIAVTPTPAPIEPVGPPGDAGPRWSRSLGLGLSVGFDGVIAANIGWLVDEQFLVEVALGIVYPTADTRFRWIGMKSCLSPFVGVGLLMPFGSSDRFDLDLSGFSALYELGEAFHVDIGLAYTPFHRIDFYAGVSFLTPFDQDHPDTVVFFPQFTGGVSWYF